MTEKLLFYSSIFSSSKEMTWMPILLVPAASSCALKLFKTQLPLKCMNSHLPLMFQSLIFHYWLFYIIKNPQSSFANSGQAHRHTAEADLETTKLKAFTSQPLAPHMFKHIHNTLEWILLLFGKLYMILLLMILMGELTVKIENSN